RGRASVDRQGAGAACRGCGEPSLCRRRVCGARQDARGPMIRVIIYLMAVGILAFAAVWLADRPCGVVITWQKRRSEMSVMVLAVGIVTVALLFSLLWTAVRAIMRAPDVLWLYLRTRRGVRGYIAVSRGLIAVGTGDARAARRFADEAQRIAPTEPLTLLLSAQASQLAGDPPSAARTFHVLPNPP